MGNASGGATVADVGSCCWGTDDTAGGGGGKDSGVIPIDGVDGWCHTSKPSCAYYCWAEPLTDPDYLVDGGPIIAVPSLNSARR